MTPEEIDLLAEALGDARRRSGVRCLAADRLGEAGKPAARAVPVLLAVLQEKGDVALPTRTARALGRVGDRRPEVLTPR